ncbi:MULTISPECIES: translation initiation factor IF-3 [Dictyoglomus]|uniref:Translation initiation factor IF-3 n=1 Tax=Dictyoglomus turgidum (strain DSM 6724 / Z-1310) TaxID=515635 RepID=B8E0E3_DICTD|nr:MULTISPECIES: translation initiation factor IF-3 [Dictyoglomus]ACK42588.1 translation initiation factor IF-3 [Dictyoglomus turgidum DSM 6724]PNV80470.1 MAG: translation initiation factor IF-3 [Dictyoglomus turgidum]HBU31185.1 translation initiation factor IF-3 [Dictyoglomus sp.]
MDKDYRVNEKIRAREIRVVDEDGKQLGIMPVSEALKLARERNLDLVEVAPNANPPVCKIMDFGKFKYELARKEKEAKKNQKIASEVKEIKIRPNIEEHDYQVKLRKIREFLEKGYKVRLIILFKGRQLIYNEWGDKLLERILQDISDLGTAEKKGQQVGMSLVTMLIPGKKTSTKKAVLEEVKDE